MSIKVFSKYQMRRWLFVGFVFVHCLLIIAYYVSDSFTGTGFDESVVYFLQTGAEGVDMSGFGYLIGSTLLLIVVSLYACYRISRIRFLSNPANNTRLLQLNIVLVALLLAQPVFRAYTTDPLYLAYIDLTPVSIELVIPGEIKITDRKNLVYIYLESFERALLDEDHFPGLAPNLRELEKQGLAFTNIEDLYGTRWTMAGMVSSQCGLPLMPLAIINQRDSFMAKAKCLGDIFNENGYQTSYLGGASMKFAGKGTFYRTHRFDSVVGREELMERFPPDSVKVSEWGYYDEFLFERLHEELSRLTSHNQPFALLTLTLDTHPPRGLPSPACDGVVYGDGKNNMLNAYHCSDRLVGRFIRELMASELADSSIFVVASDHVARANEASELLKEIDEHRNLFFILDKHGVPGVVDRPGSLLDVAPTLLSYLGAEVVELNLGVDLFGDEATFVERTALPGRALERWALNLHEIYQ